MAPSFEAALIANRIRITELTGDSVTNAFRYGPWTRAGYQSAIAAFVLGATVLYEEQDLTRSLLHPGLSHAIILPSMTDALAAAMPADGPPLAGLRVISVGGPMTWRQAQTIRTRLSPRLYNGFASTETNTLGDTPIPSPDDLKWHRLVGGFDVQVVDDQDRPLPPGQIGALRVATRDAPEAYVNDEVATRAHFRGGYFYTGDLAVFREDGRLALQGRTTEVINVGGDKISPAPIEQSLKEALPVAGVCVFSRPDAAGEEELHVVLETAQPIDMALLTEALRRELRGFPHVQVHFAASLRRNDMGKIVRKDAQDQALGRRGS